MMFTRIDRYIARLVFVPLVATLAISAMLLLLDKMLKLFDFVMNEGGPVSVVWRMLGNLLPQYLGLAIPIGLFLGVLLAFRKLALSSEIDALQSSGISYMRLLRAPFVYALVLAAVNLAIVGYLQPYSRYAYEGLRYELRSGALGASIKVGEFARFGDKLILRVDESRAAGSELVGIFARMRSGNGRDIIATAESGRFLATDDPDVILFRLNKGVLINIEPKTDAPRVLRFGVHDLPIDLPQIEMFRARGGKELELTLTELWQGRADPVNAAAFHRRLIMALSIFLMPFLGLALAIPPKRSANALGVFLGIVMLVVYNEFLKSGERLAAAAVASPWLSLWGPTVVFAGLSLWMYHVLAHHVGGQPLGAIIRETNRIGAGVKAVFTLTRRRLARAR